VETTIETRVKEVRQVVDELETLLAVELLEYHDSNWLALDPKQRNEQKREVLRFCINMLRQNPTPPPRTFRDSS
jgi:hypothetical protein